MVLTGFRVSLATPQRESAVFSKAVAICHCFACERAGRQKLMTLLKSRRKNKQRIRQRLFFYRHDVGEMCFSPQCDVINEVQLNFLGIFFWQLLPKAQSTECLEFPPTDKSPFFRLVQLCLRWLLFGFPWILHTFLSPHSAVTI